MINLINLVMKKLIKFSAFTFVMLLGFAAPSGICCDSVRGSCSHPNGYVFANAKWVASQYCTGHECLPCQDPE